MGDHEDFLAWVGSDLRQAETVLHQGDPGPRHVLWSRREPVSVLGAWKSAVGQPDVRALFDELGTTFASCESHAYEVVSSEVVGDLAYTAGYEHTLATVRGEPRDYTLRVTQVYRRENGSWRVVHRHADSLT